MRILIVEDEKPLSAAICRMLEHELGENKYILRSITKDTDSSDCRCLSV